MKEIFAQLNIDIIDDRNKTAIPTWLNWYKGYVKDEHDYTVYNGKKKVSCKLSCMHMAKRVCEDWANLLMNEKVSITVGTETQTQKVRETLEQNRFCERMNQLVELTFALGTGALVEFLDGDNINIDYISADKIFPITAENGDITECAFCSLKRIGGKNHTYVNIHRKDKQGCYVVENYLFDEYNKKVPLPEGVEDVIETKSDIPLFQILHPNVVSNICPDAVMGMSIYANALHILKALDVVFDSYKNEFVLGKKRLIVPLSMVRYKDDNGDMQPMFDANDVAFYGLPSDGEDGNNVVEIDMNLRTDAHDDAMRQFLNQLSESCGFGTGYYDFERSGGLKTATEIISEKSDLFRSLKKHEGVCRRAVSGMVRAILFLMGENPDTPVTVDFDDSIIEDRKSEFSERLQLVTSGVYSPVEFRMWKFGETEEVARKAIAAISGDMEDREPEE